jgi:hypothetical protein
MMTDDNFKELNLDAMELVCGGAVTEKDRELTIWLIKTFKKAGKSKEYMVQSICDAAKVSKGQMVNCESGFTPEEFADLADELWDTVTI